MYNCLIFPSFRLESVDDLTKYFPEHGIGEGVSSMIVSSGVWQLFTEKHQQGTAITINGKNEFGPGTRIEAFGAGNDKAKSLKYIRDE